MAINESCKVREATASGASTVLFRCVLVLITCLLPITSQAVTVCKDGTCDFMTIMEALQDPMSVGQSVIVDPGTYNERDLNVVNRSLVSSSDDPSSTIIDGLGMGTPAGIINAAAATIRGFTIRGGNNQGSSGGGIRLTGGPVSVENTIIENNNAVNAGGGIGSNVGGAEVTVIDSIIRNNTALSGGAIRNNGTSVTVINSQILGNTASGATPSGGGIFGSFNNGFLHIKNSTISGNRVTGINSAVGGGVVAASTTLLENVTFQGNMADAGLNSSTAGGLRIDIANVTITGGSFTGNVARRGGGIFMGGGGATVSRFFGITVTGNTALDSAGGIFCSPNLKTLDGNIIGNTPEDTVNCFSSNFGAGEDSQANSEGSGTDGDPVNTFTGELFDHFSPDLNLGGPFPLAFSRYYAYRLDLANIHSTLGTNWRHNYAWTLSRISSDVEIVTGDGRKLTFTDSGTAWNQVGGLDHRYQFEETAGGFTLTDMRTQLQRDFDTLGLFAALRDGRGNIHTLLYGTDGRLASVADGLGRMLTFTHDANSHLTSVGDGTRTVTYTYVDNNLIDVTDPLGNTTVYFYNPNASAIDGLLWSTTEPEGNVPFAQTTFNKQVTTQTNADGQVFAFAYNGLTTTLTDPNGNTRTHTHSANGELLSRQDQTGQSFSMGYDVDGRRSTLTDRLGETTSYGYHGPSGKVSGITHADGTSSSFAYAGRVVGSQTVYDLSAVTHADGSMETLAHDAAGNVTSRTDQLSNTRTFTYNGLGQLLTATNAAGGVTTKAYNVDATLASEADAAGNLTTYAYDALRRQTLSTDANLDTRSLTWDENDNPLTITDERGNVQTLTYDGNGNLLTVQDALLNTVTFGYDGNDRLLSTTSPLGGVSSQSYEPLGHVGSATNANNNVTTFTYNTLGRLSSVTDPLLNVWPRSYNAEAIIASTADPLGNTRSFVSDAMGRITQATSPLGNVSRASYDAMGRVATTTDALNQVTSFSRDARGQLSSVTLPGGSISVAYARNALGQLTTLTDPNGNNWNRGYDNSGRLTSSTDPLAQVKTTSYDNRNRPSVITFPGTLGTQTLSYDAAGNLTDINYTDGTVLGFRYDANDHLIAANDGGVTPDNMSRSFDDDGRLDNSNGIAVVRDAGGRITSMTLAPSRTVVYAYDANDRLTTVTDWAAGVTTFSYDITGRLTGIARPNGVNNTNTWDNDSRLTGISEGIISSISLTRDAKGQTTDATRNVPQVASAFTLGPRSHNFDAASQIVGYSYDALGRRTAAGTDSFVWDAASRLSGYTAGGVVASNSYDALGRRTTRTAGGVTADYVWNDALGLASISVEMRSGADHKYYIHTPAGALLHSVDATTDARQFYHYDEMGNTLFVTNDAGSVIGGYAYSPYGELMSSTGALDNPFTWQGENGVMDEGNGLYYIRARYYDSATGRFISRDPLKSMSPKQVNPYQYAANNPMRFVDVSGLDLGDTIFGGIGKVALAVAVAAKIALEATAAAAVAEVALTVGFTAAVANVVKNTVVEALSLRDANRKLEEARAIEAATEAKAKSLRQKRREEASERAATERRSSEKSLRKRLQDKEFAEEYERRRLKRQRNLERQRRANIELAIEDIFVPENSKEANQKHGVEPPDEITDLSDDVLDKAIDFLSDDDEDNEIESVIPDLTGIVVIA